MVNTRVLDDLAVGGLVVDTANRRVERREERQEAVDAT